MKATPKTHIVVRYGRLYPRVEWIVLRFRPSDYLVAQLEVHDKFYRGKITERERDSLLMRVDAGMLGFQEVNALHGGTR